MRIVVFMLSALALLLTAPADACSCASPGPPCAELFTQTVFVGTARATREPQQWTFETTFDVTETLHSRAPLGSSVVVRHTAPPNCGLQFEPGKAYVIYASGDAPDALSVGACSRTHPLQKHDADVAYAHAPPSRSKALVSGQLVPLEGHAVPLRSLSLVVLDGGVTAQVAANGKFSFEVAPGRWELALDSPLATFFNEARPVIDVPTAAACATPTPTVQWNGRIIGTVRTADGGVAANVPLVALAQKQRDRHWQLSATSGPDGQFEIGGAAPGAYLVAVSAEDFGGVSPDSPWPTAFAPGVSTEKQARVVKVGPGARSEPVSFTLPPALGTVELRVLVTRPDGTPLPGANVNVAPRGGLRSSGGATDSTGVLVVKELAGLVQVVRACDAKWACTTVERAFTSDATVTLAVAAGDGGS
jgi:hypothetical protein